MPNNARRAVRTCNCKCSNQFNALPHSLQLFSFSQPTSTSTVPLTGTDNNVSKLYTAEHPSSRKAAASNYRQGWQHAGGGVAPNTGNIHSAVEKCYKLPAGGGGRGGEGTIPSDDERNFGPSDNQEPTLMVMTTTVGGPQSLGDERWTLQRGAATTWVSNSTHKSTIASLSTPRRRRDA